MDQTCRLWNAETGDLVDTLTGHTDEILDVTFDMSGKHLATASADGESFSITFDGMKHKAVTYLACVIL